MNLEALGISEKSLPFSPWVRAIAVLAFGYLAVISAVDVYRGQVYGVFPFLIGASLACFFAVGRSLKPALGVMVKYGAIAALLGAMVAGFSWVLWGRLMYGDFLSVITLPVFLVFSLLPAATLALPMMKLRRYLAEPYYFLVFLLSGFIAGVIVSVLFHDGNPLEASAYVGWELFGALGSIYAIAAWQFLKATEEKWFGRT